MLSTVATCLHCGTINQAAEPVCVACGGGLVVVETTPRVRIKHKKWTEANLASWLDSDLPVRISGWLMFDPEHRNHMGKYRKSMWEIHPITKIEVWKNDKWVNLDNF